MEGPPLSRLRASPVEHPSRRETALGSDSERPSAGVPSAAGDVTVTVTVTVTVLTGGDSGSGSAGPGEAVTPAARSRHGHASLSAGSAAAGQRPPWQ